MLTAHDERMAYEAGLLEQVPGGILARAELLSTVGSTAHGVSVSTEGPEGDDLDVSGFYVPEPEQIFGMHGAKAIVWRSKPKDVRSEPGDVDLSLQPLQKFIYLAYAGNPTILSVLFSPDRKRQTAVGGELRQFRLVFGSKRAGEAFKGYAHQQYLRLMGERGQMKVKRPELIEAHGYDVKYAAHVLRLCHQGEIFMREGWLPMPIDGEARDTILNVRRGQVEFGDLALMIGEARARLEKACDDTLLPDHPDLEIVNSLAVRLHRFAWERQRLPGWRA